MGPAGSPTPLVIAVDAMGGDNAPDQIVRGAVAAVRDSDVAVLLVGRREACTTALAAAGALEHLEAGRIRMQDAGEVVGMDEHPASAVRAKRDSSIVRACEAVASSQAAAVVSAGNSGAVLAAALLTIKRAPGVARPAIGALVPTLTGPAFVLDAGANTDCKPQWLAQFALMGSVYARIMMGVATPRVGLLSTGEEPGKGSALVQAATPLIAAEPVNFVGNVEGRDIFRGACDVAVTDGFTGNVALKTAEGVGELLFALLRREASAGIRAKLGGLLLKPRLRGVRDRMDYRHTGGALLLGVAGEVVVAHGRSDAVAVASAIRVAATAAEHNVSGAIARAIGDSSAPSAGETAPAEAVSGSAS